MNRQQQKTIAALTTAGVLWGLTVPLSKLSLAWLSPAWLAAARFTVAAALLGWIARRELRTALRPAVLATGAVGFGGAVLLQNLGIEQTSVSHAAVVIGAVPVLVAVLSAAGGQSRVGPRQWAGNVLALGGVVLIAGLGGGSTAGDGLVFASSALSALFVVVQPRILARRDPAAVTAVQFAASALLAWPLAVAAGPAPAGSIQVLPVVAFAALSVAGTVLPFWLFAAGQARAEAQIAGAYLNLEPVVGVAVGWLGFGDHAGLEQVLGVFVVLAGLALSTLQVNSPPDPPARARTHGSHDPSSSGTRRSPATPRPRGSTTGCAPRPTPRVRRSRAQ